MGNIIVWIIIAAVVFFSGRSVIRSFRNELNGGGCAGCGSSSGCCGGNCAHAREEAAKLAELRAKQGADGH
ncbi:FeoB-associated Cys-rich membrane protein [Lachnoclostridium sp. Marseille-P6806]|uniref:FeoB-associated Cys-rich membrane protein n=1 Tax=Lachnoclostridium sp. Marseille-P6806 TaxID=2364793 RepID=UPI0013EF0CE3|nr:FeoB-associated Cys-rich membrane protein [Lachnoclostridium sp. Marseille-P6806]